MATLVIGPRVWRGRRDTEGHREYNLVYRVSCSRTEGPYNALNAAGLPLPGSVWQIDDENDPWAFCQPDVEITPVHPEGKPNEAFDLSYRFSTKPPERSRCQDQNVEDPLLLPPITSGGFLKFSEEAIKDRFGNFIKTSSHEQVRGPQVEFDGSLPQVIVEQNVATPYDAITLPAAMRDTVCDASMWGLPKRSVKLSEPTWSKKYYGQCFSYYTRRLVFEVNVRVAADGVTLVSGWDRDIVDEGTKALSGHWDASAGLTWVLDNVGGDRPNKSNPRHFIRYKDLRGENTTVILDGNGQPYNPDEDVTTDECAQCPAGAPVTWQVTGLESFDLNVDLLHHDGECTWVGRASPSVDSASLNLTYESANSRWLFTSNALFQSYQLAAGSWSCLGPNTLTKVPGEPGPNTITLSSAAGKPGNIHVEYYRESNFALLGIPLVL